MIESRTALNRTFAVLIQHKKLLSHVYVGPNIAKVVHLLLLVPNALVMYNVTLPARKSMIILTRDENKVNVAEVVV